MAVVTQKLIAENRTQLPKLQILIYPWAQMIDPYQPASIYYSKLSNMILNNYFDTNF